MAILKNTTLTDSDAARLPSGTTAERPLSPSKGMLRHNTSFNTLEYWNGSIWRYCPDIERQELVLNYDPGEPSSYSGGGTTVYDLSSGLHTGTLINGVSFDSANGGSFSFDGVDDYIDTGTSLPEANDLYADVTNGISWTVEAWFKPDITKLTDGAIVGRGGGVGTSATFVIYTNGTSLFARIRGGTVATITTNLTNTWHRVVIGFNNGGDIESWINKSQNGNNVNVGTATLQTYNVTIGATANGASTFFKGNIGPVRIYSSAPINRYFINNYDAQKYRFGRA